MQIFLQGIVSLIQKFCIDEVYLKTCAKDFFSHGVSDYFIAICKKLEKSKQSNSLHSVSIVRMNKIRMCVFLAAVIFKKTLWNAHRFHFQKSSMQQLNGHTDLQSHRHNTRFLLQDFSAR